MIRIFLAAVFSLVGLLAIYLFFYLGFYKAVEIKTERRGPFYLLSKSHTGAYHLIGPTLSSVETWAREHGLDCAETFGEYLDNPEAVDQDRLRSHVGCVLSAPAKDIPSDFLYEERPEHRYLVGRFAGSPSIGPFKVYPKMKKAMEEERLKANEAVIELYHVKDAKVITEYLFTLDDTSSSN